MTTPECTIYEVRDHAAWITLNRPEARNALSPQLVDELYAHLNRANEDPQARAIVLTGAGKAFCAGADLKRKSGALPSSISYDTVLSTIWNGAKPVIAAVNGYAFAGGLGLVGAADIVITDTQAVFSFSEVRVGVIPRSFPWCVCASSVPITACGCFSPGSGSMMSKRSPTVLPIGRLPPPISWQRSPKKSRRCVLADPTP